MTTKSQREDTLNQDVQIFVIGNWNTKVLFKDLLIRDTEKSQMESLAIEWIKKFNFKHQNLMTKEFSVPSNIIRFDYVLNKDGLINVFEIEDRPAGFEINALTIPKVFAQFLNSLQSYSAYTQKPIGVCVSPGRMFNSDDFFWVQRLRDFVDCKIVFGQVPKNPESHIWFIRSLRSETEYYQLSPYSLSTIQYEGDKSYGVRMGLWQRIDSLGVDNLSWDKPFVVKPDAGCRCENVHMYHPKKPSGGFSTRTKILNAINNNEVDYVQDYYEPENPDFLPDGYAMIRRCYLVYDIKSKSYKVIGGQWEARPKCHKIHGASDAICGPLVL